MYTYNNHHNHRTSWRKFQKELQRDAKLNSRKNSRVDNRRLLAGNKPVYVQQNHSAESGIPVKKIIISLSIIIGAAFIIQQSLPFFIKSTSSIFNESIAFFKGDANDLLKKINSTKSTQKELNPTGISTKQDASPYLSKHELKTLLAKTSLVNMKDNSLTVNDGEKEYTITTSLDMRLQNFVLEQLDSLEPLTRGKPEIIAMVVMEPHSGKILAMGGFDTHEPEANPCTEEEYPAASLFKMVTASAAVETCGYSPATTMYFSGGKYTLYKRQLEEGTNSKFCNKVTLAEAFAQSINPVFGKLGSLILGKDVLEKYASSFGFNQEIDSEIDFKPGSFTITDDNTYQWAEVACGFNKTTTISPMFGAMLASTMINSGKTPVPCLVESVTDNRGKTLYKRKNETLNDTVKPDTAKAIMQMMNGTIVTGTARKSFRGVDKDSILSKLNIGGKTGSLSSYDNTIRFDWFAGFCSDNQDKQQIVVSVLVGHGKYIGTKASIYGRLIFKEYFNNYFALNSKQSTNG